MIFKGRKGASLVGGIIAVLVGIIMIVAVTIPVVQDTITNQAFTGTWSKFKKRYKFSPAMSKNNYRSIPNSSSSRRFSPNCWWFPYGTSLIEAT